MLWTILAQTRPEMLFWSRTATSTPFLSNNPAIWIPWTPPKAKQLLKPSVLTDTPPHPDAVAALAKLRFA